MEITKILFATDFLEGSANAIPYVADLAKRYGANPFISSMYSRMEKR